ncbi:inactive peptidyl-prolyl cis-trans isomerase FKBP6-like [Brachionus plicatilis]|uniref:peptidylprolyl isomerase n=1 Tax=Brachionus plicatilis TaxID=10195 RepID=A0A3M7SXP5_BRAPC|nr:inactive peptidyl-prolyl cis-trans isomerase FKBP6-like [Brachionus plicatilis]
MTDVNNNNRVGTDFDTLTPENVELELQKLKLIDSNYDSDEDERDRIKLTGKGLDFRALKAGQDIEFEYDPDKEEDNYNWDDEIDKIDYKKVYDLKNPEVIMDQDDDGASKTPFEILRAKMEDVSPLKDGGVLKRTLIPGSGLPITPGSRARIHYNAYFEMNDEPFDSTHLRNKSFEFKLGNGEVVRGLDIAVSTMKRHEKSQFIFEPEYYCGKFGCEPRVPKETPVLFEIEVISFVEANAFDNYEASSDEQRGKMSLDQILKICNCLRELGNDNYKRLNFREASKKYRKAIYLLDNTCVTNDDEEKKWIGVMLKLYLNMSQVCLKRAKPKKTIYYCKLVLDLEAQNAKAIYRYGKSLRMLQDFDRARKFLLRAYKLAPTSKEIADEITQLDQDVAKYKNLEKNFYAKMFKNEDKIGENELNLKEVHSLDRNKEIIVEKLNEFKNNDKMKIYKVQMDMFSLDILNFIIKKAEELNLCIRQIKGETNIMQIMKRE